MHPSCKLLILTLALIGQDTVHTIFGGKEAEPHSRPYMALVERKMTEQKTLYCGGFLVSEDFVMTAAQCNASSYRVFLGVHDFHESVNTQTISVVKSFMREDYNPEDYRNDLLLLKLSSKAVITSNVSLITLAGPEDVVPNSCSVSGWGRSEGSGSFMSNVLMGVNVNLTNEEPCNNDYFFCCKGRKGSGQGDSGNPLVCENGKAYGVVSNSFLYEDPIIHHFAKISPHKDWIDSVMKNEEGRREEE